MHDRTHHRGAATAAATALTMIAAFLVAIAPYAAAGVKAGTLVTVEVADRVRMLEDGRCKRVPVRVAPTERSAWEYWEADVVFFGPEGRRVQRDYAGTDFSQPNYLECDAEARDAGRYRVEVRFTGTDADGVDQRETVNTSFRVRVLAKARTWLRVRPVHVGHREWTITARLTQKYGRPVRNARLAIQVNYRGYWGSAGPSRTTNRDGVARWTANPSAGAGRFPLRILYRGTSTTHKAVSKSFRIYP